MRSNRRGTRQPSWQPGADRTAEGRKRLRMDVLANIRIALRALRVNKMRSALTMLGIIIGVGAVITMVAVGTGASKKISEQMARMGSNLLIILPGSQTSGGLRSGFGGQPTLTLDDSEAI